MNEEQNKIKKVEKYLILLLISYLFLPFYFIIYFNIFILFPINIRDVLYFVMFILSIPFLISIIFIPYYVIKYFYLKKIEFKIKNQFFRFSLISLVINILLFIIFGLFINFGCNLANITEFCGFPFTFVYSYMISILIITHIIISYVKAKKKFN